MLICKGGGSSSTTSFTLRASSCSSLKTGTLPGCSSFSADSYIDAELQALSLALRSLAGHRMQIQYAFTSNHDLPKVLSSSDNPAHWRRAPAITFACQLLESVGNAKILVIPCSWMDPVYKPAVLGANLHVLNLFLSGRDLPRWVMKSINNAGFSFL
ncbi:hypothetical protein IHE45_02G030900 [Dioscorea alata]|uniref:Uncharacterized protein n=1 Tax=Dioscorea alata TaxID=55571 RepID=A0ACB7WPU4_DIOAL|nr:hypothetical protein IHE45_02G030900 [Dioscorea alata]